VIDTIISLSSFSLVTQESESPVYYLDLPMILTPRVISLPLVSTSLVSQYVSCAASNFAGTMDLPD